MLTKSRHWYSIKKLIPAKAYDPLLQTYYNIRSISNSGTEVSCPICNKSFRKFIDGHACPSCGSGKRHRLLFLFLKQETNFFKNHLKVLHFAPEHCFYKKFAALSNLDYISGDLNSPRAMLKIDMTNIQFESNTFDVVISSHVLEHIPDDLKAMMECYRIAKPGSWSIHQAPIDYSREKTFEDKNINNNDLRLVHYGHIDHKRIYGADYKDRLKKAGFLVKEIPYPQTLEKSLITKFGLDPKERIYLCKKPFDLTVENE